MVEQGPASHAHQRLWHPVGQRAHADAETGGKDHGFGGLDGHLKNFSNPGSSAWLFQRIVRSIPIGRPGYAKAAKRRADHITVIRAAHRSFTP
jgi:hypothetical protein